MKFRRQSIVSSLLASALVLPVTSPVVAQQPAATMNARMPAGVERGASVEGITEYRLKNGLRVLLFPDQTKQTITVNITYLVGSANENYGETGMAHLLEHLVFKGTPRHPNIPAELTSHGTRPNGTTWLDRTNYFETFAATDENLNWALDLEADRMVNSFIAKKDLESEFSVVRNEFESGENDPFRVTLQRMMGAAYEFHNYGKSTIGARSDIENVPIDRLQAFYKNYYQPDNAVLLVAGKFDEPKTLALVDKYFSPIPKPTRELRKLYTQEPTQDGERLVTVRRVGDVQLAMAAYRVPAGAHPDSAAVQLLSDVMGNTPSGRLHKALVEPGKAAQTLSLTDFALTREPGVAVFGAVVQKEKSIDDARETMIKTIESVATAPVTKEEVERARAAALKNIELLLNSSDRVGLVMSELIAMGDWRLLFINRDRLRRTTPEQVQAAAAKYLKTSNRTVAQFIPTTSPARAEMPATPDVAALVRDYKGDAAIASGEAFDPSPANIEARLTRINFAPNATGLKIALLPKETRGDAVNALLSLRFGDEKSLVNRSTAANLAAQMLTRGTQKRTRQQIADEFDKLKAQVNATGSATGINARIQTTSENLPAVMRLVAEILREPSFPATEFDQLKAESIAAIENQMGEPIALGQNEITRILAPYPKGDVRYTPTFAERVADLRAVTLDDVKSFYKDFYGASVGELAVVGDFDKAEVTRLATELFGNFKSPRAFARVPRPYQEVAAVNKSLETPDKANAFFVAGLNLRLRDDHPDYPALLLGDYMIGGGFLNSRLATRIRQKEGISYGVRSQLNVDSQDEAGLFAAGGIYAPQNVQKFESAFKEEIARAVKDGFTPEEIDAAKKGFLQSRQVSRSQDAELVSRLANYLFFDRTLKFDEDLESRIAALTPEQIAAAMRRHITPDRITIIKAGDFAKQAAK